MACRVSAGNALWPNHGSGGGHMWPIPPAMGIPRESEGVG